MQSIRIPIILVFSVIFSSLVQNAQAKDLPTNDLKSPYNSIWAHLYYLQKDSYNQEEAIRPFLLESDQKLALEKANNLLQIYDWKGLYVQMDNVPKDSLYIDSLDQKAIYYPFRNALPDIYLIKKDVKSLFGGII